MLRLYSHRGVKSNFLIGGLLLSFSDGLLYTPFLLHIPSGNYSRTQTPLQPYSTTFLYLPGISAAKSDWLVCSLYCLPYHKQLTHEEIETLGHVLMFSCSLELRPLPKRKGGSDEYSTSSHYWLAVAMDSTKAKLLESLAGLQ